MSAYTDRRDGFRVPDAVTLDGVLDSLIARALLVLVETFDPTYYSPGGIERTKTGKQRQIEEIVLAEYLKVLDRDFHLITDEGTTDAAIRMRLIDLALERGLLVRDATGNLKPTGFQRSLGRAGLTRAEHEEALAARRAQGHHSIGVSRL